MKRFEIMVAAAIFNKNLGPPIPKQQDDSVFKKTKRRRQKALICELSN